MSKARPLSAAHDRAVVSYNAQTGADCKDMNEVHEHAASAAGYGVRGQSSSRNDRWVALLTALAFLGLAIYVNEYTNALNEVRIWTIWVLGGRL